MFEHLSLGELLARWQSDLRAAGLESIEARSGVADDGVAAAEARLGGVRLPPSYLAFMRMRDGMGVTGASATGLRRLQEVGWFRDLERQWYEIWRDIDEQNSGDNLDVSLMARALLVSTPGDQALLLDPDDIDPITGEWACYTFSNYAAGSHRIGHDFRVVLEYLYTRFLASHDVPSPTREETSDVVEQAYQRLLAGELDGRDLLTPRMSTSWRATLLAAQHDAFLGTRSANSAAGLDINRLWFGSPSGVSIEQALADPVLTDDLVPYFTVRFIEAGSNLEHEIRRAPPPVAEQIRAYQQQIADGSGIIADFSYCPGFAAAAQRARELIAAQHEDAAAWEVIRAALPEWTPRSTNHLTPVGLYYDKDLRKLFWHTRQRGAATSPEFPTGTHRTHVVMRSSPTSTEEEAGPATVRRLRHNEGIDAGRALTVLRTPFRPASS